MVATLLGVGLGAGLWLLLIGLRPPAPSPESVLAALRTPPTASPDSADPPHAANWSVRAGRPGVPLLTAVGLPTRKTRRDLKILDRRPEALLAEQFTAVSAVIVLGPLTAAWFAIVGLPVPLPLLLGGIVVAAVAAFWSPVLLLASEAEAVRVEQRETLSLYLDLAGSILAAGGGVEQSLNDAAGLGEGRTLTQLRGALATARLARTPIPTAIARLADQTDSPDLQELAASLRLTGTEGSRIKEALAAKAGVLRARRLADAQAQAESANERTALPVALMFFGFLVVIGFPAVMKVLVGLS